MCTCIICALLDKLTVGRQLHHQLVIAGLGSSHLVLNGLLVLVNKHLGALTVQHELLIVCFQALDDFTVLLRAHLGQLNTHRNIKFKLDPISNKTG